MFPRVCWCISKLVVDQTESQPDLHEGYTGTSVDIAHTFHFCTNPIFIGLSIPYPPHPGNVPRNKRSRVSVPRDPY